MRRSNYYEETLAQELRDKEFAQGFLLDLIETKDDFTLEEALKHTIVRMGIKEFAAKAKVPRSNVSEFLKGKRKLKPETLDLYLKPFGLKTKLVLEKAS